MSSTRFLWCPLRGSNGSNTSSNLELGLTPLQLWSSVLLALQSAPFCRQCFPAMQGGMGMSVLKSGVSSHCDAVCPGVVISPTAIFMNGMTTQVTRIMNI